MSFTGLEIVDRWLQIAIEGLDQENAATSEALACDFARKQLTEIRKVIAQHAVLPARPKPPITSVGHGVRTAVDQAVSALSSSSTRLSPHESVVLSKLLVFQSLLRTTRFAELK
jgi:hypothetical protein